MPRYYFDVHNRHVTIDEEGIDCTDPAAARARAVIEARTLAAHEIQGQGCIDLSDHIIVRDDKRTEIATVTFGDAIQIIT